MEGSVHADLCKQCKHLSHISWAHWHKKNQCDERLQVCAEDRERKKLHVTNVTAVTEQYMGACTFAATTNAGRDGSGHGAGNSAAHTTLRMAPAARRPQLHYDDDGAHSTMALWLSRRWSSISITEGMNLTCRENSGNGDRMVTVLVVGSRRRHRAQMVVLGGLRLLSFEVMSICVNITHIHAISCVP